MLRTRMAFAVVRTRRSRESVRGLRCSAFVSMVKTTDLRNGDHASRAGRRRLARHGRILVEREMRARSLVVDDVRVQDAAQAARVPDDDVVEAVAAN